MDKPNRKKNLPGTLVVALAMAVLPPAFAQEGAESESFDGQWQYAMYCASCHGTEGEGIYPFGVPLRDNALVQNGPPEILITIIQEGRYNRDVAYPDYSGMPAFHYIRGGQAMALVNYMKEGLQAD